MKKGMKKILASLLAAFMAISMSGCVLDNDDSAADKGYSYLAIDINPSMELLVNGETVVSVKACNEDAAILLSGENLEDMTVEEATEKVVELAEELGYLNEENDDVSITVSADEEDWIETLAKKAKKGAEKGSELAKVNNSDRSADIRKVKKLQEESAELYGKLTPAKLRLIEAIMEYDETMTYEIGASMKVDELVELLDDLTEEFKDIVGEEMEELFKSKYEEMKKMAEGRIADVYGDEYKALWERYLALQNVAKEIKKQAENPVISEEDKQAIMDLLGLNKQPDEKPQIPEAPATPDEEQTQRGDIDFEVELKIDEFDKYFDKHRHGDKFEKSEELEDKLEDILDAYDEDEYVLKADNLAAIAEAWGETIDVATFGDLEDFLDEIEEDLEEMRENVELDSLQKGEVQIIEQSLREFKKAALSSMEEQIRAYQEKLQGLKTEKRKK